MKQILYKLEEWLAMAFFATTTVMVFIGALTRTVGAPLVWSVDVAQLTFAWACVLGADIALKHNSHVVIDIAVKKMPTAVRRALGLCWQIAILVFLGLLIWYGVDLTLLNTQRSLGDAGISYAWVTVAIPVGAALMAITTIDRLFGAMTGQQSLAIEGRDGDAI